MTADTHVNGPVDAEDERLILDAIEKWLEQKVKPVVMQLEHDDEYPHELVEDMKELGLFGALFAPEYGGLGLSATTYSKIVMLIAEEWMSLTGIFNSHLMMSLIVGKFGTEDQKQFWLPKFASGEMRGGLALTEPDAGTDLQGIRTVAKRKGDNYVVNGTKTWISNAIEGHCVALLVKTDPDAEPRHKGMTMLIVPKIDPETKAPLLGISNGRKLEKLGYKGIDSGEFIFDNYECDVGRSLVGGVEGQGFTWPRAG